MIVIRDGWRFNRNLDGTVTMNKAGTIEIHFTNSEWNLIVEDCKEHTNILEEPKQVAKEIINDVKEAIQDVSSEVSADLKKAQLRIKKIIDTPSPTGEPPILMDNERTVDHAS